MLWEQLQRLNGLLTGIGENVAVWEDNCSITED